jgi:hypothetical protein
MTLLVDGVSSPAEDDIAAALIAGLALLPAPEQSLLGLVAISVSCSEENLLRAAAVVEGVAPDQSTVDALRSNPLVERVGGRLRVVSPLDLALARSLCTSDPARFASAHEVFADLERQQADHADDVDELQAWENGARVAYYLMRNMPIEATAQFIDSFDGSPAGSRRTCRIWLSHLAARYTDVTDEQTRVSDFFSAFRLYMAQDREQASHIFERILDEDRTDKVAAVSLHLLALCLDQRQAESQRLLLLEDSIALSESLALRENLLMSRNSLIYARLAESRRRDDLNAARQAVALAADNDSLAREVGDPVYEAATRRALAVARWRALDESEMAAAIPEVTDLLAESQQQALRGHDLGAWILAAVSLSDCYRSIRRVDDALDALEAAVLQVETAAALPDLPRRQFFEELDRVLAIADPADHERGESLSRRFRRAVRKGV